MKGCCSLLVCKLINNYSGLGWKNGGRKGKMRKVRSWITETQPSCSWAGLSLTTGHPLIRTDDSMALGERDQLHCHAPTVQITTESSKCLKLHALGQESSLCVSDDNSMPLGWFLLKRTFCSAQIVIYANLLLTMLSSLILRLSDWQSVWGNLAIKESINATKRHKQNGCRNRLTSHLRMYPVTGNARHTSVSFRYISTH